MILTKALNDKKWEVRAAAAITLGKIGDVRAVQPLITTLNDMNNDVRNSAIWALVHIGSAEVFESLMIALKDKKVLVRKSAAEALGEIGEKNAVEALIARLKDVDEGVRFYAASALGKIGDARAVKPLILALKDKDCEVRNTAVNALAKIDDNRAVEPLIGALQDSNVTVRTSAAHALEKTRDVRAINSLIPLRLADLESEEYSVREDARRSLVQIGAPAVQQLISFLNDGRNRYQFLSAEALGEIGDPRAVEPLINTVEARGMDCKYAIKALAMIPDPRSTDIFITCLQHTDGEIRVAAAKALVNLYASGQLSNEQKQLILDQRSTITKERKEKSWHTDRAPRFSSDCPSDTHEDYHGHQDSGIGVSFPI